MSDIKKTALIVLILTLLTNIFTQNAYAANDYNHSELLEYEGYGEAMYESIVEQTTFITGQYTDNKEYVSRSIDQIKDYANSWKDDFNNWDESCNGDFIGCMRGMVEAGGGYALTVGDWIKNLFKSYDDAENKGAQTESTYAPYFYGANGRINIVSGYYFTVDGEAQKRTYIGVGTYAVSGSGTSWSYGSYVHTESKNTNLPRERYSTKAEADSAYNQLISNKENPAFILPLASSVWNIQIYNSNDNTNVPPDTTRLPNQNIRTIYNYINENGVPPVVVPKLKPQLVCPDGTRISMNISGSTFLSVEGTVMMVGKDGTAEVNGQLCNLNWQKPSVDYDPDGNPVLTDPDGTETNLNTGDTTPKPPGATDLEGCTGVLCGIGKLLDGVGSVVKAIGDLVKKLLDGLLGLFVPEDLDFVTEEFNKITKKLNDKIAITDSLKEAITSVFDGGGSNPLANISINLPITNEPLTFGNVSFIEEGVPILRRVISAIVVLYTIAYVYRKITGRGGVMER